MKHSPEAFYRSSCQDVAFDDYLLLGGGTDISPRLYEEKDFGLCQSPDTLRDQRNVHEIGHYLDMGKPIFGICRGFQLMDAVFGGKLIQHTSGHPNGVTVTTIKDFPEDKGYSLDFDNCENCHHQVVDHFCTTGTLLGWSQYEYKAYFGMDHKSTEIRDIVPQILYWPGKKALAVQFHPEWQGPHHEMNAYLRTLIKAFLNLENVL